ncbi:MAG: hypothetical protein WCI05_08855 [Myxococcales bacterium]
MRNQLSFSRRQLCTWGLVFALPLFACVSKPTVALKDLRVTGPAPGGLAVDMVIQVNNKNSFAIQIRNIRAMAKVADKFDLPPIVMSPNELWLNAATGTTVSVPVIIPWNVVPGLLSETAGSSTVQYRVTGVVNITASRALALDKNDEPLDETGEIPRDVIVRAAQHMIPGAR